MPAPKKVDKAGDRVEAAERLVDAQCPRGAPMTERDIVGPGIMARWLLDARDPKATFAAMLPAVWDKTSCALDDGELFGLAMAFAGFGAVVCGDFKDVPAVGEDKA